MKKHNFNPGPATIPPSVLEEAAHGLLEYRGSGLSFAELSHRAPQVMAVVEEASTLVKTLYGFGDQYEVIWMQGGASAQLAIAPMNLLDEEHSVALINTGYWATKAIKAAGEIGRVAVLASSEQSRFDHIPKNWTLPADAQYLHLISNETIDGTQWQEYPDVAVPIVADMTSDFLTRPLPLEKFGLIFASAQKNFGIAGCTCVVINKDWLHARKKRAIPTIFDYQTHIETQSLYHTAPTFPIYVACLVLRWTLAQGGLAVMAQRNAEKAALLYNEIDENPLFTGSVQSADRSLMNACFRITKPELEEVFLNFTGQHDVVGIKGFPTVGGFRASMYNALPLESVQVLVDLMRDFAKKY
ncbi:3-phosphoserine/phosphohydroxythreonine transaminase [Haliscomenobacter sp.]|uniref:3-phosphoserine/phosphohydroxythreonine transaminase n=1 Tax=Haliscomenobacter sp. TaxID=2717303 RepID=UPI003592F931